MSKFTYTAMNEKGIEVSGVLQAENALSAVSQIREMGYFPTQVSPARLRRSPETAPGAESPRFLLDIRLLRRKRIKAKTLAIFTRQLAALIDAGLPLLKSLNVLKSQSRPGPLKDALAVISERVEGGSTFSHALTEHPKIFNNLFVNMVKAGEAGGVLELVLNRLAEFLEKAQRLKSMVKSAMIYPSVVLTVAVGVVTFLVAFVVPRLKEVFDSFSLKLPPVTQTLIRVSTTVRDHLWYSHFPYVGALLIVPIGLFIAFKILRKTERGGLLCDTAKLRLPVAGSLLKQIAIARFSRTLGTLLTSGVPILQALDIVRGTSGNRVVSRAVKNVHDGVREGESIAASLGDVSVFTPVVVSMIEVGEETGKLPEMLTKIADNFEEDVDNAVSGITSVIEPVLIVFLAVVVGFIAISMLLPLIEVIRQFSGDAS